MLRIVPSEETISSIQHILRFASKYALIISPFYDKFSINNDLRKLGIIECIEDALSRGVNIVLICRYSDDFEQIRKSYLKNNKGHFFVRYCDTISPGKIKLHSKIYMNENECLITSFNLASFSLDSFELGVLFDKETHQVAFHDVLLHVNAICKACGVTEDNKLFDC